MDINVNTDKHKSKEKLSLITGNEEAMARNSAKHKEGTI